MTSRVKIPPLDPVAYMAAHGHQQLALFSDRETGLQAIVAIHDTTLGPALGGTRMKAYATSAEGIEDVLRLSEAMTYKASVAGLDLGGGKAVIFADGQEHDPSIRAARLQAFGRCIESLGGRFITAEDVGTSSADMLVIRQATRSVVGLPPEAGGGGDPSPMTAFGVLRGMQALVAEVFQQQSLSGMRVAVQGLGHVGMHLVGLLVEAGADVIAADVRPTLAEEAQARYQIAISDPQTIHQERCDVFAPCALGSVLNSSTIPQLRCRIVAGSANNQLWDEERDGAQLAAREIIYAVDYVINAGGLIHAAQEVIAQEHWSDKHEEQARCKANAIYDAVKQIHVRSQRDGILPARAARELAMQRILAARSRPSCSA